MKSIADITLRDITKILIAIISIALIIWGCFSSYKIYQIFSARSATYGDVILQTLPGDDKHFDINEDESIFLAYTVDNLELEEVSNNTYRASKIIEELKYDPKSNDYNLYVNAHKYIVVKLDNMLDAQIRMQLLTPDGKRVTVDLGIRVLFYAKHTELIFTIPKASVGYVNQMMNSGMNIRLIESPVDDPFVINGTLTSKTKERQHFYSFAVTPEMMNIDKDGGIYCPYYVYTEEEYCYVGISRDTGSDLFLGMIYHAGFNPAPHYPNYEIPWESDTPTIKLPGLIEGSNYKLTFEFANGVTKETVFHYQSKDEYFGYGDDVPANRSIKLMTAIPGGQAYAESAHFYYAYEGDAAGPGTNPYDYHGININQNELYGAFNFELQTESYGTIDLLINPSFYTKNGNDWSFTCAVYLVNPLPGKNSGIVEIVNAMHNQIVFNVTINY